MAASEASGVVRDLAEACVLEVARRIVHALGKVVGVLGRGARIFIFAPVSCGVGHRSERADLVGHLVLHRLAGTACLVAGPPADLLGRLAGVAGRVLELVACVGLQVASALAAPAFFAWAELIRIIGSHARRA